MGSPVVWFGVAVVAILVVAACAVAWLIWRRIRELRTGGIDVALRVHAGDGGRGWHLGVAHYRGEEFAWYRVLSLRSGPNWVLNRSELGIGTRRQPSAAESDTMPAGATVLHLTGLSRHLEVAMAPDALTGFLSWLESAPPGRTNPLGVAK
jgi:hypothetical protein